MSSVLVERLPMNDVSRSLIYVEKVSEGNGPLLVLLHGYGSSEQDLISLTPFLPSGLHVVCPRAPVDLGWGGHAWFDLTWEGGTVVDYDHAAAIESSEELCAFLTVLRASHPDRPFWLGGFSQGAMMSLAATCRLGSLVEGLVFLSGRLLPELLPTEAPVLPATFVSHGLHDEVIPIAEGRSVRTWMGNQPSLEYNEYPMGHEIDETCLRDLISWFRKQPA